MPHSIEGTRLKHGVSCDLCAAPGLRFARKAMVGLDVTFTLLSSKVNPNLMSENIVKMSKIIFGDSLFTGCRVVTRTYLDVPTYRLAC